MTITFKHFDVTANQQLLRDLDTRGTSLNIDPSKDMMLVAVHLQEKTVSLQNSDGTTTTVRLESVLRQNDLSFSNNTLSIPVFFKPLISSDSVNSGEQQLAIHDIYYKVTDLDGDGDEDLYVFVPQAKGAYALINGDSSLFAQDIPMCITGSFFGSTNCIQPY